MTISDNLYSEDTHYLHISNSSGQLALRSRFFVCPNQECRKVTLKAALYLWERQYNENRVQTPAQKHWDLVPSSDARPFPEYVPKAIRIDYEEACLIRALSPKAAATLARRTLQGILRDFYGVKAGRLVDEIESLKAKMDPELLDAIHAVRKVGNIGAHMEADIDVIVDVDPGEAQLLIELVETMIEETYERREQRKTRLQKVTDLAAAKEQDRKAAPVKTPSP
ncbi:hypothetical protein HNQ60_000752 [Povalibacter uvarum]|uniref:DUF4145 domain-containing protein n=1 Tax=Povalibacter uvarum TaxID=732238 RepID=A0A841HGK3_9GAMM|nr:DUF4145 domain-containing protein [Povalibacter uvarum]MBB6091906.1 hypothetical protein [Povalibacter uvarum]